MPANCSHCGTYEAHDSRGWCRRCVCAHVADPARFERLRRPSFYWLRFAWHVGVGLVRLALGKETNG